MLHYIYLFYQAEWESVYAYFPTNWSEGQILLLLSKYSPAPDRWTIALHADDPRLQTAQLRRTGKPIVRWGRKATGLTHVR